MITLISHLMNAQLGTYLNLANTVYASKRQEVLSCNGFPKKSKAGWVAGFTFHMILLRH
jgi:hypothetical protein